MFETGDRYDFFMSGSIVMHTSMESYFEELLRPALAAERLELSPVASTYILKLVSEFGHRESLFARAERSDPGTPTLFELYLRAVNAAPSERCNAFRYLGDVALFVSGFFAPHIERSLVGVNYYVEMGGNSYRQAATLSHGGFAEVLEQLAVEFRRLVEVMTRVAEQTTLPVQRDLGALFERWSRNPESEELGRRLMRGHAVPMLSKKLEVA